MSHNGDTEVNDGEEDCEKLGKEESRNFGGVAARMNYMSMDDIDLLFGVKVCS